MAGGADLFVVCKKCGSEVSPYITECPYCGTRLRKRAPKIDRDEGEPQTRAFSAPSLGPLRTGEIPGIKADPSAAPYATLTLVALSLLGFVAFQAIAPADVVMTSLSEDPWRYLTAAFSYDNVWYTLAVLVGIGIFGWRLEMRHGPLLVIALFLACGIGGNAIAVQLEDLPALIGAPGAAMGFVAAWAVPDALRAARHQEYEGDLLGALVVLLVIGLMPLAVPAVSAIATLSGLVIGAVAGLVLSRTAAAR